MQELIKILLPVLIAIGYVRGRLNGLVSQVDGFQVEVHDLEKRVNVLEVENAKCLARRDHDDG